MTPRRRPGRRHPVGAARVVLLVCAVVLPAALLPAVARPAAARQVAGETVSVVLDSLRPTVARPGDTLSVRGRLVNEGSEELSYVSVRLRRSRIPIDDRAELAAVADGSDVRDGNGLDAGRVDPGTLTPGETVEFTITLPVDALRLPALGSYPIAVEVRGAGTAGFGRVGIARTFLPYLPADAQVEPVRLAWVWPLVDEPRRGVTGRFDDDVLADALADGGRLGDLVAVGGGRRVTWLVDPMLLEAAAAMAAGYEVTTPRGAVPGEGTEAARAWLDRLREVSGAAALLALPYGDIDAAAATGAGLADRVAAAVDHSADTAPGILGRPVRADVVLPPGGQVDGATVAAYRSSGVSTLLVADGEGSAGPVRLAAAGGAELPAVRYDSRLSALAGVVTSGAGRRVPAQQRFLAETLAVAAQAPAASPPLAVVPPARWSPRPGYADFLLTATESGVPWLAPAQLPELLAEPASDAPAVAPTYPDEAAARELPPSHLAQVRALDGRLATVAQMLTEPERLLGGYRVQQLRLLSAGWRGRVVVDRVTAVTATGEALTADVERVRILPATVNLGERRQPFPLTVANDLDQAVRVRLTFTSPSPRLHVAGSDLVEVAAGAKEQVSVSAEAVANGVVTVQARLRTESGAPIGDAVAVRVRVTQFGIVGIALTSGAVLVLLAAVAVRVVRRVRGPAAAGTGG